MSISINERLRQARKINAGLQADQEQERIGTLRGGSSGIATIEGDVAGKCPRLSFLRSQGIDIQEELPEDKLVVFDRGRDQEFSVLQDIEKTLEQDEVLLREDEIPISWITRNGTKVTGRPDGVICNSLLIGTSEYFLEVERFRKEDTVLSNFCIQDGSCLLLPKLGLEVKSVGSFWVTRDVLLASKPKLDHLIQATHYYWKLQPTEGWKLIYRQNSQLIIPKYPSKKGGPSIPGFISQFLPKAEDDIEHRLHGLVKFDKSGNPGEIKPYTLVYDLQILDGRLKFKLENTEKWIDTVITTEGIENYYELVASLGESKVAPQPPSSIDYTGEEIGFNVCDYCPLGDLCCGKKVGSKLSWNEWLEQVKQLSKEISK